ncbi:MAG: peptide chain release factor N(5)-glutamine methyltransferase [Deltaproteobacteria bacterium]|nr:peptide chain release factor N(5)-glutamine methyltransferase [Deltaproteobacteria bacterium]
MSPNSLELYRDQLSRFEHNLETLKDKPEETPLSTLQTLWHYAGGTPLSCAAAMETSLVDLSEGGQDTLKNLVSKRLEGSPLAYIVGRQRFMGLELLAESAALIPRAETEQLAGVCLELLASTDHPVVLDQCTGSGNLPLCFADRMPRSTVYGSDISDEAIELARRNAQKLGFEHRVEFRIGDLFAQFEEESFTQAFDLISCAPPYISAVKVPEMPDEISNFEPSLAFEAGAFGVSLFMRLIKESVKFLKSGGWLVFEVGLGQGKSMSGRLERNKAYQNVKLFEDQAGDVRVVAAQKI